MCRGFNLHKPATFSLSHNRRGVPFAEQEAFAHTGGEPDASLKEDITINLSLDSIAPSPINIAALECELASYNSLDAAIILDGFRNGFKINYEGPHEPTESKNIKSANQHPEIVQQKIQKELRMGRIAGPFDQRPLPTLRVSPIGLVPKRSQMNFDLYIICPILLALQLMITLIDSIAQCNILVLMRLCIWCKI